MDLPPDRSCSGAVLRKYSIMLPTVLRIHDEDHGQLPLKSLERLAVVRDGAPLILRACRLAGRESLDRQHYAAALY
jgi:hypothetical protein